MDHTEERDLIRQIANELLARDVALQRPTIAELLRRSGLERWKLTHRHRDLNDEFLASVARKWGQMAPATHPLQKKLAAERAKAKRLAQELRVVTAELRLYAAAVEELRLQLDESERLRAANIHRIDPHRRPPHGQDSGGP